MPIYDLVIVGGTLSNLQAALTASRLKLKTLLIEEEDFLGKHYAFHGQKMIGNRYISCGMRGSELVENLTTKLKKQKNLDIKMRGQVVKMSPYKKIFKKLHLKQNDKITSVLTRTVYPGRCERSEAISSLPRWDHHGFFQNPRDDEHRDSLPGVLPLLGAELLLHRDKVLPGNRIAIIGTSNLALCLGLDLVQSGVYNLTFIEEKTKIEGHHYYANRLKRCGFHFYMGAKIQKIVGDNSVQKIILKTNYKKNLFLNVDTVIVDDSSPTHAIEEIDCEKTNAHIYKIAHNLNKISKKRFVSSEKSSQEAIKKLNKTTRSTQLIYCTEKNFNKDLMCQHPGELIFYLEKRKNNNVSMLLPWEFYPTPRPEDKILALNEKGKPLMYVPVISVEENKKYGVALVMIQAPSKTCFKIKALQPPLGIFSFRNSVLSGENVEFGDIILNNRKTRVHLNIPVTASLWENGIRNLNLSKTLKVRKKLFCNTGVCDHCQIHINGRLERACLINMQRGTKLVT